MTRQRLLIALLAVGVVLDLVISVALGYAVVQAHRAASQTHIVKVAAYEACLANNDAKVADARRWSDVLKLVRDGNDNPAITSFIKGVEQANAEADTPHDCGKLVP